MKQPPIWTAEELARDLADATAVFRRRRMEEPLEAYLDAFDDYQSVIEELLEATVDLAELDQQRMQIVLNDRLLHALRYLPGPPISEDDLKTVAEVVLTPRRLKEDEAMVERIFEVIRNGLDRRRFPWVGQGREPSEAERTAAVVASAAIMALRKLETERRGSEKERQEAELMQSLEAAGLTRVATRKMQVLTGAPGPGQFCAESLLGTRKVDVVVGLWDGRTMLIECKVSNSAINSVKRLNNDAAAKAEAWRKDYGIRQVVPAALLSGVYKLHNLLDAQQRGLTLFWSHNMAALIDWVTSTRR